ncbi:MAG TPA: response regulator [Polyangiaceae bacterium LLY-WYZ-15_(1-7)]|nr:response regulator [Polyangiaceae bacterium LLY-WYZ-15_(1-7)]HJL01649.1 response regulator [Polyangiaceae bacterium LLY-WYZ-15_(1-7)]HJL08689.1 response regulator [Polyangiaceae bacterium LLY-WYZ-15_(1-7)]HJL23100.1 response regulator [Polyangiaceae bacterium LLY-WYZ-15_(1-7)]HJL27498.1 response regulator [Polyangiaceae bacterium LLY-WYZ-15_(1-7)]
MRHEVGREEVRQELDHRITLRNGRGSRIQVLFAEDNQADAELLIEAFAEIGAEVECVVVASPHAFFEQLHRQNWDMLLVDLRLGPYDGHELLERLRGERKLGPETLVAVLSSSAAPADIERSRRYGIHGYLRKPFTIERWVELASDLVLAGTSPQSGGTKN